MGRWVSDRRRTHRDDQRGYTFVELIISIVILTMITGALGAAFVTAMNGSRATADTVRQSNDAQVIAAFFVRDAQAAGGSDPNTASLDQNLGVSLSDAAGCTVSPGSLVVRFKWLDRFVNAAHQQMSTTHVASYYLSSHKLIRQNCVAGSPGESLTLAHNVEAILPTGKAVCIAPSSCVPLPDAVRLTVNELRPSDSGPTTYTFTLTANVRPQGQSFTSPPSSVLPFSPALFALGGCSNGIPGISVSGGGSGGYVTVAGAVVVNGVDNIPCTAMTLTGNSQYSATTTSIQNGGTCGGSNCAQAGTISGYPTQLLDPYAGLTPPGDCNGPQTGSFSGGHYTPGRYLSAVSVNSTVIFDPGNYILCNGMSFQSQANVTANGVLFYVANGALTINGQATVSMTAATSGLYAGILIWIPATSTFKSTNCPSPLPATDECFVINGGATVNTYNGLVYAPNVDVVVQGSSGSIVGSIIARTISFSGGGQNTIGNPPSILAPATLPDWTIGNDYGSASRPATMTTTGGTTPYTWSATGLPTGLAINASTGVIGGTPSATGTWSSIVVTVTDARNLT
ncbi:MAG: putative Ig domain-containing protein, partial [Actinomycetota bacterium]|nr:putative Ig domain-containing protein [Actinomycetota bacterium]